MTTGLVVDVELGPLDRSSGVTIVSGAQVDTPLHAGDRLTLRDEGGHQHDAHVDCVTQGVWGPQYRVSFLNA